MSERLSTGRKCLSTHNLFLKGVVVILQMILGGRIIPNVSEASEKVLCFVFQILFNFLLFNRMFYVRV